MIALLNMQNCREEDDTTAHALNVLIRRNEVKETFRRGQEQRQPFINFRTATKETRERKR